MGPKRNGASRVWSNCYFFLLLGTQFFYINIRLCKNGVQNILFDVYWIEHHKVLVREKFENAHGLNRTKHNRTETTPG